MQEVVILTKEEYEALQDEIKLYRSELYAYQRVIKKIPDSEHNYVPTTLVIEINKERLKKLLGNDSYINMIILQE